MAYDRELNARIGRIVRRWAGVESRPMFGGVCHLLRGSMFAGIWKDFLVLRLGEKGAAFARELPHVRAFDITGPPMKGWVMVAPAGCRTEDALRKWLGQARDFARTLPARPSKAGASLKSGRRTL